MHWTTYRHIPGDAPEKAARPQARQPNSVARRRRTTLPHSTTKAHHKDGPLGGGAVRRLRSLMSCEDDKEATP